MRSPGRPQVDIGLDGPPWRSPRVGLTEVGSEVGDKRSLIETGDSRFTLLRLAGV